MGRDELAGALRLAARVEPRPPASRVHKSLADLFERHEPVLQRELERARKARVKDLERVLEKRKKREKANVQVVMEELRAELSKKLEQPEPAQLPLFSDREKEQLKRNGEALRLRIAQIPADIAREQAAIEARYEGSEDRVFPVSITWKASPATRMMTLLHGAGVRLGVVTNGEHWMLVHAAPGETTTYVSFYANLWFDEPLTLRAFAACSPRGGSSASPTTRRSRRSSS
jgi:phosphoglycolate phosphatase-like HAD superfamily hydrolase